MFLKIQFNIIFTSMYVEIGLVIFYIFLFSLIIKNSTFFKVSKISYKYIVLAFIFKCFCGISSFIIHEKTIIGGDMKAYYNDAKIIYSQIDSDEPLNYLLMLMDLNKEDELLCHEYQKLNHWDRSEYSLDVLNKRSIIRFNAISMIFAFNSPFVTTVFISFLSTIGLICLLKIATSLFKYRDEWFFLGLFLLPSSLFWNSSILKESLTIFSMGYFLITAFKFSESKNIKTMFLFLLSSLLFLSIKAFFFLMIFPFILLHIYFKIFKHEAFVYFKRKNVIIYSLIIISFLIFSIFFPSINIFEHIKHKQKLFLEVNKLSNPRSGFNLPVLKNWYDFIIYLPNTIKNTLIQPQLLSLKTYLYLFPIIENILIFILFLTAIFNKSKLSLKQKSILISLTMFVLLSLIIIGYTVPIQGAISRYKAPLMPIIILIIIMISSPKKIHKKWPKSSIKLN